MSSIVLNIIRKRNPAFQFDNQVDSSIFVRFILENALGLIRGLKLLFLFKKPQMAVLGRRVRFIYTSRIKLGKNAKFGNFVTLQALGTEGIQIGDNVSLGDYSKIVVSTSLNNIGQYIKIGDNVGKDLEN